MTIGTPTLPAPETNLQTAPQTPEMKPIRRRVVITGPHPFPSSPGLKDVQSFVENFTYSLAYFSELTPFACTQFRLDKEPEASANTSGILSAAIYHTDKPAASVPENSVVKVSKNRGPQRFIREYAIPANNILHAKDVIDEHRSPVHYTPVLTSFLSPDVKPDNTPSEDLPISQEPQGCQTNDVERVALANIIEAFEKNISAFTGAPVLYLSSLNRIAHCTDCVGTIKSTIGYMLQRMKENGVQDPKIIYQALSTQTGEGRRAKEGFKILYNHGKAQRAAFRSELTRNFEDSFATIKRPDVENNAELSARLLHPKDAPDHDIEMTSLMFSLPETEESSGGAKATEEPTTPKTVQDLAAQLYGTALQ